MDIIDFIKQNSQDGFFPIKKHFQACKEFNLSFREVEKKILEQKITPLRYKRNQSTISIENQLTLFNSTALVVGCGGLGGFISEFLTRIGVGNLILIDGDVFEEHNLNRQNFSNISSLGRYKSEVLKEALEQINPATNIKNFTEFFTPEDTHGLIDKTDIVIDALDSPKKKTILSKMAKEKNKAFVHGAIGGFNSQFMSNQTLEHIYKNQEEGGIELTQGNPVFTVAFAASIQVCESINILLKSPTLDKSLLFGDLKRFELMKLNF